MHMIRRLAAAALAFLLIGSGVRAASADTSIGAGLLFPNDGSSEAGVLGSLALYSIPGLPIRPQITGLLAAGSPTRYAVTAEAEFLVGRGWVGIGAGPGRLQQNGSSGLLFDAFAGAQIVPHVQLQARLYGAGSNQAGSGAYVGVAFHL